MRAAQLVDAPLVGELGQAKFQSGGVAQGGDVSGDVNGPIRWCVSGNSAVCPLLIRNIGSVPLEQVVAKASFISAERPGGRTRAAAAAADSIVISPTPAMFDGHSAEAAIELRLTKPADGWRNVLVEAAEPANIFVARQIEFFEAPPALRLQAAPDDEWSKISNRFANYAAPTITAKVRVATPSAATNEETGPRNGNLLWEAETPLGLVADVLCLDPSTPDRLTVGVRCVVTIDKATGSSADAAWLDACADGTVRCEITGGLAPLGAQPAQGIVKRLRRTSLPHDVASNGLERVDGLIIMVPIPGGAYNSGVVSIGPGVKLQISLAPRVRGGGEIKFEIAAIDGRPCRVLEAVAPSPQVPVAGESIWLFKAPNATPQSATLLDKFTDSSRLVFRSTFKENSWSARARQRADSDEWLLYIKSPAQQTQTNFTCHVAAVIDNRDQGGTWLELPVSVRKSFFVRAYEGSLDNNGVAIPSPRLSIDFGTTNTCVAKQDSQGGVATCVRVPEALLSPGIIASGSARTDEIPTKVSIRLSVPSSSAGRLDLDRGSSQTPYEILVGHDAEHQLNRDNSEYTTFAEFKTLLGSESVIPPLRSAKQASGVFASDQMPEFRARDLAFIFIRELLLSIRFANHNAPIERLDATFPSVFNLRQRDQFMQVLRDVAAVCCVRYVPPLRIDEANAGALAEVRLLGVEKIKTKPDHFFMVFDFGGGTLDVAAIAASEVNKKVRIRPLGMTGVSQLGGKTITQVIAKLLTARLVRAVYADRTLDNIRHPQNHAIPFLPFVAVEPSPKALLDAVSNNIFQVRRMAELIKRRAYGIDDARYGGLDRSSANWYQSLPENLLESGELKRELIAGEQLHYTDLKGESTEEVVRRPPTIGPAFAAWLNKPGPDGVSLTRSEVDAAIIEAIDEAVARGRRLWESVSKKYNVVRPDKIVLSGSSSRLPLLWKRIETIMGIPNHEYIFTPKDAKTIVAKGASLYAQLRATGMDTATGALPYVVNDCADTVLLPISYLAGPGNFTRMFDLGHDVTAQNNRWETRVNVNPHEYYVTVFEDMDLRPTAWEPSSTLLEMGITEKGKQLVGETRLGLDPEQLRRHINSEDEYVEINLTADLVQCATGRELKLTTVIANTSIKSLSTVRLSN